jgi:site-specific recombinase XerD
LLATTYAGGLRVSEVVALKVADLDADRMTLHIRQGKGGQDRYVPLSQRLLQDWRA